MKEKIKNWIKENSHKIDFVFIYTFYLLSLINKWNLDHIHIWKMSIEYSIVK